MTEEFRITPDDVQNLSQLFIERVRRSPGQVAYRFFNESEQEWQTLTWQEIAIHIAHWQHSLKSENLSFGDRIAIMMKNSPRWVIAEQAALGLGLVVVPLYTNDRAENARYIINDAGVKLIFVDGESQVNILHPELNEMPCLSRIITMHDCEKNDSLQIQTLDSWLTAHDSYTHDIPANLAADGDCLSSIVYTSGTTGKPKGVMLSHTNILTNAYSCSLCFTFLPSDLYLSFLPLSHMFERTVGYYLPLVTGSTVAYSRSIEQLADDLLICKPNVMVTVPRIFERVYHKIFMRLQGKGFLSNFLFNLTRKIGWHRFLYLQKKQAWRPELLIWPILDFLVARKIVARLGGQLRVAICGGAPLSFEVSKLFTSLGVNISQGYGLTETSPVVCTNRIDNNDIASVGEAVPGVKVKLGKGNELLVHSPGIMQGYWHDDNATKAMIDSDGWLHTGDKAKIIDNHIYITGRLKDIIVLSNGEKISPCDIEMAICNDPLFDQALVLGERKPFLSAILVLNQEHYEKLCLAHSISTPDDPNHASIKELLLQHVIEKLNEFPGYAKIYRIHSTFSPWTIENRLATPTLKLKRNEIIEKYSHVVTRFYQGH